jgi:hypothetical protein
LYTRKIERVRDVLTARGVGVSEVRKDYQGTRYFEIRDIEGNLVEISEEP